jgi:5-methylcytosine-specific restriction endonuclease McrA
MSHGREDKAGEFGKDLLQVLPARVPKRESGRKLTRDMASEAFIVQASEVEVRREKEKARLLRKSRWWQQKLARGECSYCARRFPPADLTMDHVVPLVRGGKSTKGNVAPVCKECNTRKKDLLPMEWEAYMQEFRAKK